MDKAIVLLIYLIVIPVLASNDQFLPDLSASEDENSGEDTEDESKSNEGENEDQGSDGGSDDSTGEPEPDDTVYSDEDLTEDLARIGPPQEQIPGPSRSGEISNPNGDSGVGNSNDDKFRHNAEEIATELTSLSSEEISEYPITDLSDDDIVLVFRFLTPDNLARVLLNIDQESLVEIKDRLTPSDFGDPLSRISEADRTQVANRLVLTSTN